MDRRYPPSLAGILALHGQLDGEAEELASRAALAIDNARLYENPHIFDRYWQAKKNVRESLELGLAISKAIIESMAGRAGARAR